MDPLTGRLTRFVPDNVPVAEHVGLVRAVLPAPAHWVTVLAGIYVPGSSLGLLLLLVAVPAGPLWLGVVGYCLAVIFDWAATRGASRISDALSLAGWNERVRALARQLLFVGMLAGGAPHGVAWFVGFAVALHVTWLGASAISATAGVRQPLLGYVPGAVQQPAATQAYARLHQQAEGVTVERGVLEVIAASAALLGAGWLATLCYALVIIATLSVGLRVVRKGLAVMAAAAHGEATMRSMLAETAPTALAYLSGGTGQGKYLLNQWLPALAALPDGAFVAVREASHLRHIDPTPVPVIYAATPRALERSIPESARVALYLANGGKNLDLLANAGLAHVFLGHGDSDKATSATPIGRVYDQIWVAGPIAVDRYAAAGVDIAPDRFVVIGRPQIEGLAVGSLAGPRRTVLYAPTFEGYYDETNYSSLEVMGPALIAELLGRGDVRVLFKPHPSTGLHRPGMRNARAEVNRLLRAAGGDHRSLDDDPSLTLLNSFDEADVLISDVSSVVSDFLYTQRPVLVTNPKRFDRHEFVQRFPSQAGSYLLTDVTELNGLVDDSLADDSMRAERLAVSVHVLGEHPLGPTASFIAAVQELAAAVDRR